MEVDENYFGGQRKEKRGRGAAGKVPVFSLLKRGGHVYTLPIPNVKAKTPMPILESRAVPDRIVDTDSFANGGVTWVSTFHHRRIDPAKAFAKRKGKRTAHGQHRELPEPGEASSEEVHRDPQEELLLLPQRMRVAYGRREPQGTSSWAAGRSRGEVAWVGQPKKRCRQPHEGLDSLPWAKKASLCVLLNINK